MARPGRTENLKPQSTRTKEEQREIAKLGGKRSGQVRKERKLLSQIYAEALSKKYTVDGVEYDGPEFFQQVLATILMRGDSSAVSLLKELREGTEGSKVKIDGDINQNVTFFAPEKIVDGEAWEKLASDIIKKQ